MPRKLAALLVLCFAFTGAAAQTKPAATKAAKAVAQPVLEEEADDESELLPRTVFGVLLGEFALQRGDLPTALGAWVDLARRSLDPQALERAIEIASHARQYALMLEMAREWAKLQPDSPAAQQALTSALIVNNRTEELLSQLALLLERDKANLAGNLMRLPRVFARTSDKVAVQQAIDRLAKPYIGIAEAHIAMSTAALAAKDNARARSEAEQAQQLRPDWDYAAILVAQTLARESNALAIKHLQEFVERYPQAADARLTLARLLISEKRFPEARNHFGKLAEARPNDPDILYPSAMLMLQEGDRAGGRAILEKLLGSRFPDKSALHFFLGQIDEDDERPEDALRQYQQVVAGEQFLPARFRMAQLLARQGKLDAARQVLRETSAKTPAEQARLAMAEAALLREAKRHAESLDILVKALKTQPEHPELLYETAMAAEKVNNLTLMESHLGKLLQLQPENAHALNALGYSLADRNLRLDEAATLIDKAAKLAPTDPFIMDSVGWVQFRQGKLSEALTTLENAFRLRPDPEIAAHLGEVLWALNRRDEALKVWRDSAAKHPDSDVIKDVLRRFAP